MESNELTTYEAEAQQEANRWLLEANRIVIDDGDTAQAAADWLTEDLAPRRKAVEAFFAPLVAAAHAAHKALTTKRGEILSRFEEPERIVKLKLAAWQQAENEHRAQLEQQAGSARLLVVPEPERITGISFTKVWKAEVVDLAELVKAAAQHPHLLPLLTVDQKKLNEVVKALGSALNIPGVKVWEESSVRRTG